MRGYFLALLIIDVLLNGVRGKAMSEDDTADYRYALLGAGIGLFLALGVLLLKLHTMGVCRRLCEKAHAAHGSVYKMPNFQDASGGPRSPQPYGFHNTIDDVLL